MTNIKRRNTLKYLCTVAAAPWLPGCGDATSSELLPDVALGDWDMLGYLFTVTAALQFVAQVKLEMNAPIQDAQ